MKSWGGKRKILRKRLRNEVGGRVKRPPRRTDVWATQIRLRIYRPGHTSSLLGRRRQHRHLISLTILERCLYWIVQARRGISLNFPSYEDYRATNSTRGVRPEQPPCVQAPDHAGFATGAR